MIKKILVYILLFILFLGATRSLYGTGYFNMHDDLQVMRLYEMEKCFKDGQIPCRWAPDMGWGYGQPMFNYYSALPYYLGYLIRQFTPLSLMETVMLLFNISLVISGIGMYLLSKRFWGTLGGIVSAVLYVYAPYHLLDVYIRGAMSESFALAILPFFWLSIYLYIDKYKFGYFSFVSITFALLLVTHNVSTMMYAPFTLLWTVYWLFRKSNLKVAFNLGLSFLLGLGMASFFFLPVFFERDLIQTNFLTMDYLNYEAHFVTLYQLFWDRKWGHGPSIFGPNDDMSFQIGWPHWFLLLPLALLMFIKQFSRTKNSQTNNRSTIIIAFTLSFVFTAFLAHAKGIVVWKLIPSMAIIQFPWRFLGISIFFLSFVVGAIFYYQFWFRKLLFVFVVLTTIILNFNYALPWNRSYKIDDNEKLSGVAFDLQRKSAILDYLPKTAKIAPKEAVFEKPTFTYGEGIVSNYRTTSSTFAFDLEVFSNEAKLIVPVMYFPKWIVTSGGNIIDHTVSGDYGLITVSMPEGKHIVEGRFTDTPVRFVGNAISIISMFLLLAFYILEYQKKLK